MRKVILLITIICLCSMSVLANSAQTSWTGTTSTGAVVKEGESPIVVNHENLYFKIHQLPETGKYEEDKSLVKAEYELYNPSDLTVETHLLFPIGHLPSYVNEVDLSQYEIMLDGKAINKVTRNTFLYNRSDFDLIDSLERIVDDYKEDEFYKRDLEVTKYTYRFENIEAEEGLGSYAVFEVLEDYSTYRVFSNHVSGTKTQEEYLHLDFHVVNNDEVIIYIVGDHSHVEMNWDLFKTMDEKEAIKGNIVLKSEERMTFEDMAMTCFDEESNILPHDWYNAFVDQLNYTENDILMLYPYLELDITENLMQWYEYSMTIAPQSTTIHSVTAPLYPSISERFDPTIYTYEYLLSPAKSWKSFGTLKIEIDTSYVITDSSISELRKTDQGYEAELEGLPEGELEFTLCEDESPVESHPKVSVTFVYGGIYAIMIIAISFILIKKLLKKVR